MNTLLLKLAIRSKGTVSRAKYDGVRLHHMRNSKIGGFFINEPLTLSNLYRSPRSHKARKRYRGDGTGSCHHGRGAHGQRARSGHGIPRGFEGGQTELRFRFPKKSPELKKLERKYDGFCRIRLDQIQRWIEIGRLDPSKPMTLASFYDAGLKSIKRGLLVTDHGSEHFTHKIHIEATEFTPETIGRIEELGGRAISVYHSLIDIKVLTRPEFYFFTEARKLVLFKKYVGQLVSYLEKRRLPTSMENLKTQLTEEEFHNFFMNTKFEIERVLKRRNMVRFSFYDVFGEQVKEEAGVNTILTRQKIKDVLVENPDSLISQLIKGFFPPFTPPVDYDDIKFYTSDEQRGYLSPFILNVIGNSNKKDNLYPGYKYWIARNYIVATGDWEQYDAIVQEFGWENQRLKEIQDREDAKESEVSERDKVIELLQAKGLKLDVPRFIGPKEPWKIKKEGKGEVFLLPIDFEYEPAMGQEATTETKTFSSTN